MSQLDLLLTISSTDARLAAVLRTHHVLTAAVLSIGLLSAGCAAHASLPAPAPQRQVVAPAPPVVEAPAPRPATDPVAELIKESTGHFDAGQTAIQLGHLEMAREEFNRALEVLLESPYGARSEPRIREHFDRLVERISAFEVTALAQGDGFTEKKYEPATIDQLLATATFEPPVPSPETKSTVEATLESTHYDINIPLNARVLSFVELFTGRLRGYLQDSLSRGARFLPMIQNVFRDEGLPLDLAYVPLVESAFKPDAVSRAKAKGMWQFMRGTALENGLKSDWYIDERAEPEKATRAAAAYLKSLYATFGDWHLALASYNSGPGRVQSAIRRSGSHDFWKLSASRRYLPQETRDYVPLILAAVIIARNPAQYGIDIEPPPAALAKFETVTLPVAVDLRRVAEWAGTSVQAIQDLNPELRRWTTPIRAKDYSLKVPDGTGDSVRAALAEAGPDAATLNWHTVRKGETLLTIARKLGVNRQDLADANYLSVKSRVTAGQQLVIPRAPTLLLAARTDNPAPLVETRKTDPVLAASATVPNPRAATPASLEHTSLVYRVKSGDTLASIARGFHVTTAALKKWNGLRTSTIRAGQRLTILTTKTDAVATK